MSATLLVVISVLVFLVAYATYGAFLAKKWGIDVKRKTPAHTLNDGVDYLPAKAPVLLGHHFSSIAGAGPIVGPIGAAIFGWVPVFLWILIGSIFFGGVHDMGALFASVRHDGKSLGEVIGENIGESGKKTIFCILMVNITFSCCGIYQYCCGNVCKCTGSSNCFNTLYRNCNRIWYLCL